MRSFRLYATTFLIVAFNRTEKQLHSYFCPNMSSLPVHCISLETFQRFLYLFPFFQLMSLKHNTPSTKMLYFRHDLRFCLAKKRKLVRLIQFWRGRKKICSLSDNWNNFMHIAPIRPAHNGAKFLMKLHFEFWFSYIRFVISRIIFQDFGFWQIDFSIPWNGSFFYKGVYPIVWCYSKSLFIQTTIDHC